MHHFNWKSLTFYGGAIGVVVVLFSLTTSYGETALKAPTKVAGRYRLEGPNLPGCLQPDPLVLTLQQSGIYLSGSLLTAADSGDKGTAAKKQPSLHGSWNNHQLELSGPLSHLDRCRQGANSFPQVKLQGTVEKTTLQAQLTLEGNPPIPVQLEREPSPSPSPGGH